MSEMKYIKIPYVDKKVSRILYGTARAPFLMGGNGNALLDSIFATGVNTFDTARAYMEAEKSLGRWIEERNNRDQIVVLSKCGHPSILGKKRISEELIRKDFSKSIKKLRTNYIDIYLLHRDDLSVNVGPIVEVFNAMHSEGKIGAFGGSNWTHNRIEQANEYAYKHNLIPFTVSSPNFGLADQVKDPWGGGCITISGPSNIPARQWYEESQMPVIAYSSLGRGLFSGAVKSVESDKAGDVMDKVAMKGYGYPDNFERLRRCEVLAEKKNIKVPQVAMAWILNQKLNSFAIVSTPNDQQMKENIDALNIELSKEELLYLDLQNDSL